MGDVQTQLEEEAAAAAIGAVGRMLKPGVEIAYGGYCKRGKKWEYEIRIEAKRRRIEGK